MRDAAAALLRDAQARLEAAEASRKRAGELQAVVTGGKAQAAKVQDDLKALKAAANSEDSSAADAQAATDSLEQRRAERQAAADALRSRVADLDRTASGLEVRPAAARTELMEARRKIEDLDREQGVKVSADEASVVTAARSTLREARRSAWVAKAAELEQELLSLPNQRALVQAQRELAVARRDREDARVKSLDAVVAERRRDEARGQQAAADQTLKDLEKGHPALARYAKENADLSKRLADLVDDRADAEKRIATAKEGRDRLTERSRSADQVLALGAVSEEFGELVRELRQKLPDTSQLKLDVARRGQQIVNARLSELRLAERQRTLAAGDAEEDAGGQVPGGADEKPLSQNEQALLTKLTETRRDVLAKLEDAEAGLLAQLTELNEQESQLVEEAGTLAGRLDERLLWLPSAAPVGRHWPAEVSRGARWATTPTRWWAVGRDAGGTGWSDGRCRLGAGGAGGRGVVDAAAAAAPAARTAEYRGGGGVHGSFFADAPDVASDGADGASRAPVVGVDG